MGENEFSKRLAVIQMNQIFFPSDVLIEIFSHWKAGYSVVRRLNRRCRDLKFSWDGWDALVDQGFGVKITKNIIEWTKNGVYHSLGDLPAYENGGSRHWYKNGMKHRSGGLPAIDVSIDYLDYRQSEWYIDGVKCSKEGKTLPTLDYI